MLNRFGVLYRRITSSLEPSYQWRTLSHLTPVLSYAESPELSRSGASVHSASVNSCVHLLGLCGNIDSLRKIHGLLLVRGIVGLGDIQFHTKLVSVYGSFGDLRSARLVFDQMLNPDLYSWKVMIRRYFLNDLYFEIIGLYKCMIIHCRESDNIVFSIVLKACSELRDHITGRKVHCQIVKGGCPDSFVLTSLVDMYSKSGRIDCSEKVFDGILERNVVCWTSMVVGYVQNDCPKEGLILFNRMREGNVEGNQFTLGSLVTACAKLGALHQGKWVHGYAIKNGFEFNSYTLTALVDMYVKSGYVRDARLLFDGLSSVDVVSWTAMIVGYAQNGCPHEALKLFVDAKWSNLSPNSITTASVLSSCAQLRNLSFGRSIHGIGIKLGLEESVVRNALVDMYAKCHMIKDARFIFETISDKDLITWNTIISGCLENGFANESLRLFHTMISDSFAPDAVSLVSVLSAAASLNALQLGSSLHAYAIKEGLLSSNLYLGTALLNFYAKCGDTKSARMVFDGMVEKNIITWSAMITGYGLQGDGNGSLKLYSDLMKEELKPNEVIFTAILSACSHTGMVAEGWNYFKYMCEEYNFTPSSKHYGCIVDLLARAGQLEEALDFIEKMPVQPEVGLFGAFLHGCGLYARLDLAEVAIKRMLKMHPEESCYYVLIANLYALDGRWNQVNEVRALMKNRGLSKSPGFSLVESDINAPIFTNLRKIYSCSISESTPPLLSHSFLQLPWLFLLLL